MAESYQTFRWAVLGTGAVSRRFVLGLRACERPAEVAVVAGRNAEAARRFARSLGIARHAESYEAAAGDDGVDAVYVATPPSLHEAHAMAAINAGRPVLIEKPMAMDAAGAARIAELAQRRGIFCMEAMWTRFLPALRRATEMAAEGVLGELRGFHGGFFGALTPDPAVSQFDPARGGGALMHRGVYAVSLARRFMGPVVKVDVVARIGATGVDEDCALMLTHATGAVSSIEASLVTNAPSEAVLRGTEGTLRLAPIYRPDAVIHARTVAGKPGGARRFEAMRETAWFHHLSRRIGPVADRLRGRGAQRLSAAFAGNGMQHQADALRAAVVAGHGESPVMPLDESVEVMVVLDAARAAWADPSA